MISQDLARDIASEWCGGQSSHLYSFASTGKLFSDNHQARLDKDGYLREITQRIIEVASGCDKFKLAHITQLQKLWTYIEVNVDEPDDDCGECCDMLGI